MRPASLPSGPDHRLRLLLIEDNPGDARLLRAHLTDTPRFEADVQAARTLGEGLDTLRAGAFDAVVLDLGLPDATGTEAVQRISEAVDDRVPIAVVTGRADDETAVDLAALRSGATEFLRKDELTPRRLGRTIQYMVERDYYRRRAQRLDTLARSVLRALPDHLAVLDGDGRIVAVNEAWRAFARQNGGDPDGYVGRSYLAVLERADEDGDEVAGRARDLVRRGLAGEEVDSMLRYPCGSPGGAERWFRCSVHALEDGESGVVVRHEEVTDEEYRTAALQETEARFQSVFESTGDAVVVVDEELRPLRANKAWRELTGMTDGDVTERRLDELFGDAAASRQLLRALERGAGINDHEHRLQTSGGDERFVRTTVSPLETSFEESPRFVLTMRDVTERRALEQRLERSARYDPLTGLINRSALEERVTEVAARARDDASPMALVVVDIDGLRRVNDSLGHTAGDRVLVKSARRLEEVVREADFVARLGGDEFAVLLTELASREDFVAVRERLQAIFHEPFLIDDDEVTLGATLGATFGVPGSSDRPLPPTTEEILQWADIALLRAKEEPSRAFHVFVPDLDDRGDAFEREQDLRRALEGDQIVPYYQPVFDLATDTIVGFEALARWEHPTRGLLMPALFIDLAETHGMIRDLGETLMRQACEAVAGWNASLSEDREPLRLWMNFSGLQLADPALSDRIDRALSASGFEESLLRCEVTETVLLEAANAIGDLRERGIGVAIDDFGTGYSSLLYLHDHQFDGLKIDRAFVRGLGEDESDRAIVETCLTLGQALGLDVVAEGVEEARQLDELRDLGCLRAQGFYFSRAVNRIGVATLLGVDGTA